MFDGFTVQACTTLLRDSCVTALMLATTAGGASAQRDLWPVGPPVLDPAEAIAELESGARSGAILSAFRRDRPETDMRREGNYDRYTAAERQALLDGVERVARGEVQSANATKARREANFIFRMIYLDPEIDAPEVAEMPRRFVRIFDRAVDLRSKGMALHLMAIALAKSPPEASAIVERLVQVATGPGPPGSLSPRSAVNALAEACHAGLTVLRRLAEQDLIPDYTLARHVEYLVDGGLTQEKMEARRFGVACPEPGGR